MSDYARQAGDLLDGWQREEEDAVAIFRQRHPAFLDKKVPWLQRAMTPEAVRGVRIGPIDAQLALARWYDFLDWQRLVDYVEAVRQPGRGASLRTHVHILVEESRSRGTRGLPPARAGWWHLCD